MKSVLVPLDGSELAETALEPALRLAARHRAEVHLVSVVAEPSSQKGPDGKAGRTTSDWLAEGEARARQYLEEVRKRVASKGGAASIQTHVLLAVGRAARTILETADRVRADLLVLTTHGRGAGQRVWLGSIADQLLRSSTVPLLLLRGDGESLRLFEHPSSPKHVLVPLDGSQAAEAVFAALGDLLPKSGNRVTLACVLDGYIHPFSVNLPDAARGESELDKGTVELESYLEAAKAQLDAGGIRNVETRLLDGVDVARTLLESCEGEDVDMIALSTEGRGGVPRFLVGSVADKLIRGSTLPVLVNRRTQGEDGATPKGGAA